MPWPRCRRSWKRQRAVGLFSLAHVPMNLDYFLFHLPRPIAEPAVLPAGRPRDVGPVHQSRVCCSRSRADWRRPRAWWLVGAAVAVLVPTLLYYGGGWLQYGYRYFLDSVPFVIALCGLAAVHRGEVGPGWRVLIVFGTAVMASPACTGRTTCDGRHDSARSGRNRKRASRMAAALDRLGWVVLALAVVMCAFVAISTIVLFAPSGANVRGLADLRACGRACSCRAADLPAGTAERAICPAQRDAVRVRLPAVVGAAVHPVRVLSGRLWWPG